MKPILKKRGIILKSKDFKDSSKIITVLTNDGLLNLILKGTNKMNSGNKKYTIVPLEVDFLMTDNATISTFTEGYVINNYTDLKSDYDKNLIAMVMIEKILAFCEHIDDKTLFYDFVKKIFELLNDYNYEKQVLNIFEIKLLYLLGISPNLNTCTRCKQKVDDLVLSIEVGGTCCMRCAGMLNYELNIDQTKIFKYLYLIKLEKIDEKFLSIIELAKVNLDDFIDKYYEKYMDFHSKSKKIIKRIS